MPVAADKGKSSPLDLGKNLACLLFDYRAEKLVAGGLPNRGQVNSDFTETLFRNTRDTS